MAHVQLDAPMQASQTKMKLILQIQLYTFHFAKTSLVCKSPNQRRLGLCRQFERLKRIAMSI